MALTQYERGRQREIKLVGWLVERGWWAARSPGSRGEADVIAMKRGETPRLIQLKAHKGGGMSGFGPADRLALSKAAQIAGAEAWLVSWPYGQKQPSWVSEEDWPRSDLHTRPDFLIADRGFETPCWAWNKYLSHDGYGKTSVRVDGKRASLLAHRRYYEDFFGPIPDGLQVDHLCRHRDCVNPEHLEAVTPAVNKRRAAGTKLTPDDVRAIRVDERGIDKVAADYGVHRNLICRIRKREIWKDIAA